MSPSGKLFQRGVSETVLKKIFRFAVIYLILSALAALGVLIDTWPRYPHSVIQWSILLIIALPLSVLGEWLADRTLRSRMSHAVENRTKGAELSWLRVGYLLALTIVFTVCAVLIFHWLHSHCVVLSFRRRGYHLNWAPERPNLEIPLSALRRWHPSLESRPRSEARPEGGEAGG